MKNKWVQKAESMEGWGECGEVWDGCQAVSLLSGPLGRSQQRLPYFCLRPQAGTDLRSLATDTIDHAIFSRALYRGFYYHSDQLNHQPFPPPPSQTNPPWTFLPNISSARGRPAGRSGNIAYCRMYSWQTRHKQQQRPQGWKGWSFIGNDTLKFYFKRGILDKVCVRNTGEIDNGSTSWPCSRRLRSWMERWEPLTG